MIRILHCGKSIENFNICLDKGIVGFMMRGALPDDTVYLVVKHNKKTYCGARCQLDEVTNEKPWQDADRYVLCYSLKNIEFCHFFDVSFLAEVGGMYWTLKYFQGAKPLDAKAIAAMAETFKQNKCNERQYFNIKSENKYIDADETDSDIHDSEVESILTEVPDAEIKITGTFQTVSFLNETDKLRGLENLVNQNFYNLFTQYKPEKSILIPENRLFLTKGPKINGAVVQGIRSIPDALLISYDKKSKTPIQISLVEYECFGESKIRAGEKSQYLNSQIIPQLMRFASAFSIITDQNTRNENINDWIDKIIQYTSSDKMLEDKVDAWVKDMDPHISTRAIISFFEKKLEEAFRKNIHVYLIIDELSVDQKETIRNIIRSFKLDNGEAVVFDASVVKLVQRINFINQDFEYGLTVQ